MMLPQGTGTTGDSKVRHELFEDTRIFMCSPDPQSHTNTWNQAAAQHRNLL